MEWASTRLAPDYVVRGLRAVDPRTDVLWWGPMTDAIEQPDPAKPWQQKVVHVTRPMWVVGTKSEAPGAVSQARRIRQLESMKIPAASPTWGNVDQWRKSWRDRRRLAGLRYQGFAPKFFWPATDLDWAVVTEYEAMGWFARHLFEVVQRQVLKQMEQEQDDGLALTERQRLIAEAVRLETPSIWKYAMAGRRSIMVPEQQRVA